MSEPKGAGADWTEERGTPASRRGAVPPGLRSDEGATREGGTSKAPRRRAGTTESDEGRRRLKGRPEASGTALTSVEDHLAEILGTITPLAPAELGLGDADGLVLAEDVSAASSLPSFDNSGMDGYAVRVEDVAAATEESPVTLPVTAEVAAGDTGAYALQPGTSIKIMTGAMLPHGAEAVVPVEWTDGGSARVKIRATAEYGNAIRLAGEDAKAGQVLVTAGTRLRPMHIAVIAAAGRGSVLVRPRPRVVVLSTGNELAEPGTPVVPGRIWDSNSFMLAAAGPRGGLPGLPAGRPARSPG